MQVRHRISKALGILLTEGPECIFEGSFKSCFLSKNRILTWPCSYLKNSICWQGGHKHGHIAHVLCLPVVRDEIGIIKSPRWGSL